MIRSFNGKTQALPYGMVVSNILDAKVDNLGQVKNTDINLAQHLNMAIFVHMGYKEPDNRE